MAADEPLDSATDWVAEHTRQYVENDGGDFYMWRGFPTIVLTTRGRKSGALRRNALIYGRDGDDFVLIASYGGRPKHPLWYLNLVADPHVSIQEKATVTEGVAVHGRRRGRAIASVGADGVDLSALCGVRSQGRGGVAHDPRRASARSLRRLDRVLAGDDPGRSLGEHRNALRMGEHVEPVLLDGRADLARDLRRIHGDRLALLAPLGLVLVQLGHLFRVELVGEPLRTVAV